MTEKKGGQLKAQEYTLSRYAIITGAKCAWKKWREQMCFLLGHSRRKQIKSDTWKEKKMRGKAGMKIRRW